MSDSDQYAGPNRRNDQLSRLSAQLDQIIMRMEQLSKAFPLVDGDLDVEGHRKYHEAMMTAAAEQAQFWRELKIEIAKKGVLGLMIIVAGLVVIGLQVKLATWLSVMHK